MVPNAADCSEISLIVDSSSDLDILPVDGSTHVAPFRWASQIANAGVITALLLLAAVVAGPVVAQRCAGGALVSTDQGLSNVTGLTADSSDKQFQQFLNNRETQKNSKEKISDGAPPPPAVEKVKKIGLISQSTQLFAVQSDKNDERFDALSDLAADRALLTPRHNSPNPSSELRAPIDHGLGQPLWLFGSHHKAGTHLLRNLASCQADSMHQGPCVDHACDSQPLRQRPCVNHCCSHQFVKRSALSPIWFGCNMESRQMSSLEKLSGGSLRVVHIIRDPVALVVSGYLYHMHPENDFDHMPDPRLREYNESDGLAVQARWALTHTLPEMHHAYKELDESKVLTVTLEDFIRSQKSFDRTVEAIYNFTVGDLADKDQMIQMLSCARRQDLHRHPNVDPKHVAPENLKERAMAAFQSVPADIRAQLQEFRTKLGYD